MVHHTSIDNLNGKYLAKTAWFLPIHLMQTGLILCRPFNAPSTLTQICRHCRQVSLHRTNAFDGLGDNTRVFHGALPGDIPVMIAIIACLRT
jgi:hypothetical protein